MHSFSTFSLLLLMNNCVSQASDFMSRDFEFRCKLYRAVLLR
jgi:hypothetical protein